jgi:ParB-like nuclease domain
MPEIVKLNPAALADGPWRFSDNGEGAGDNTKHAVEKSKMALATSFRTVGQLVPVLVRPNPEGFPEYQVIDGHGRRDVATDMGIDVDAIIMDVNDGFALTAYITANLTRLDLDHVKISKQLGALASQHTPNFVIGLLPWPDHNTESYIELANYNWREFIAKGAAQFQDIFAIGNDGEAAPVNDGDEESNGIDTAQ